LQGRKSMTARQVSRAELEALMVKLSFCSGGSRLMPAIPEALCATASNPLPFVLLAAVLTKGGE
jgi:hypothetical protein